MKYLYKDVCYYYTKLLSFVLFPLIIFVACSSVPENNEQNMYDKNQLVKMSPQTRIFLDDFEKELKRYNKSDNFVPSEKMIKKYSIINRDNTYYISGLIKTQEFSGDVDFSGLIINTKAGNILTVNIPLNLFLQIVVNKNIKYLQIDEQVKIR
ncbi:MAG: hypothetical protein V1779_00975 [bacterium]